MITILAAALLPFTPATIEPVCPQGTFTYKVDPPVSWHYQNVEFTVVGDRASITWSDGNTGPLDVVRVIVKGGIESRVYDYATSVAGDSGLVAPVNSSGYPARISHYTVCKKTRPTIPTTAPPTTTPREVTTSPDTSTSTSSTTTATSATVPTESSSVPTTTSPSSSSVATETSTTTASVATSSSSSLPTPSSTGPSPTLSLPDTLPPTGGGTDPGPWLLTGAALMCVGAIVLVKRRTAVVK